MNTPPSRFGNSAISSAQRARSQTDSLASGATAADSGVVNEAMTAVELPYQKRLLQLFESVEKEFEALYAENCQLKQRLAQNGDTSIGSDVFKLPETPSYALGDVASKVSGKKSGSEKPPQKWRLTMKRPPALVTSLKSAGVGSSVEGAKSRRAFIGHTDAVFALSAGASAGRTLIGSASADQTARLFCASSGECLIKYVGHHKGAAVNDVAIQPETSGDPALVLSASGDRTVHLWSARAHSDVSGAASSAHSSENDAEVPPLASSRVGDDESNEPESSTRLIRQPLRIFDGHSDAVLGVEWLAGGEQCVSASWDYTAQVYDVETSNVLSVLAGHEDKLTGCSSHRTTQIVATASRDYTFRLWDRRQTMQSVAVFQGHSASVNSAVFASLNYIASSSDDRSVKIYDLRNMRMPIASTRFSGGVNKLGASAKLIACPVDNHFTCLIDLSGNRVGRLQGRNHHLGLVTAAVWLDDVDGINLATASIDKSIVGWNFIYN